MKCIYCNKRCQRQRNPDDKSKSYSKKWICTNHGNWVSFMFADAEETKLEWIHYTVDIESMMYIMTINYELNGFVILSYNKLCPKDPTQTVLRMNSIPDITPLNFEEKLPVILTFL